MKKKIKIGLDTTSNVIKNPDIKKQIEKQLRDEFEAKIPFILGRMEEVFSFITAEVGLYYFFLTEAKKCYEKGLYHATIAMVGIAVEKFCIDLSNQIRFKINDKDVLQKDIFDGKNLMDVNQDRRLIFLKKAEAINREAFDKFKKINGIRNKYLHPRSRGNPREDALEVLNSFISILKSRFSDKYKIEKGRIISRS